MLRQEAVEAIAKLKIRKFRRRVKDTSHYAIKQVEQESRDSEVCAVCLDEFQNNQVRIDETELMTDACRGRTVSKMLLPLLSLLSRLFEPFRFLS